MTAGASTIDPQTPPASGQLATEDIARANLYALLAKYLSQPPDQSDLMQASLLEGDKSALGAAIKVFGEKCAASSEGDISREYHELFVGLVRGELLPYASYYLTGFLHEKPLAKLRKSLSALGIERNPQTKEPEDHIAALLDVMAGLILGEFDNSPSIKTQQDFFEAHIGPWAGHFFTDLEEQKTSELYAGLGTIGRLFMEIEETAFQMA